MKEEDDMLPIVIHPPFSRITDVERIRAQSHAYHYFLSNHLALLLSHSLVPGVGFIYLKPCRSCFDASDFSFASRP